MKNAASIEYTSKMLTTDDEHQKIPLHRVRSLDWFWNWSHKVKKKWNEDPVIILITGEAAAKIGQTNFSTYLKWTWPWSLTYFLLDTMAQVSESVLFGPLVKKKKKKKRWENKTNLLNYDL